MPFWDGSGTVIGGVTLGWGCKYFMERLTPCQKIIRNGFSILSHIIGKLQNIGNGSLAVPLESFSGQILLSYIIWREFFGAQFWPLIQHIRDGFLRAINNTF